MGGGIIGSLNERETLSSDKIAAQAASVNYEEFADDNFSRFKDGIKYIYTEATKARNYHDAFIKGNTPTADDVEEVTVDVVNANRGTKQNPYVITNITEWNALATMAGTNYANTTGKFFALGCDIDAGSVSNVLKQIPAFGGVFCGNGYMISNIKIDSSTTGYPTTTNNGRGLFNSISGATISDLRIKISVAAPSAATYNGGLVGFIGGHSNILNCQADTTWNQSSAGDYFGGLVGRVDAGLTVLLYRCSSTFNFTISGRPTFYGGLIGATTGAVNLSIFDSSSRTVSDLGNNTDNRYSGGIVGAFETSNNANFYLENIISDIDAKSGKVVWDAAVVHVQAASNWPKKLVLKNVWASGTDTVGSTKTSRYTVTCGDTNNHKANVRGAADFTNVKSTQVYARQILASYAGVDDYSNTSAKYYVQSIGGTDQADAETKLWNGAKTDGNLPADIWGDKSTIGSGFGLTASIINPMKVTVSYYSYKVDASGTDISTPYSVTNQNYLFVSRGAPLYTPTATNRVFKGWTADPTDGSAPFKEMPSNLRGTVKLYAVWELNEASVSITGTGSSITGSATDGYELVYNGNGSGKGITLTANFSAEGIGNPDTDATITYEWYSIDKNNAYQANGGAEKTQKVENVGDSGTYSVTVKYQSKNEPLFTGEVKAENVTPVTATIKPALLTYIKVTFPDENKRPYSGADYETAVPTAEFRNSSNQVIEGTTEWVSTLHCFNDKYANVTDGVETKEIKFTPASIYNGNYGTEIKKFVEFEIEFLKLTFNIPKLSITLEVELEYGQPYTYANVATEFDKVFKPYLEDAEGYTPAFENQNGEYIKLNEYRNQTGTAYSDVITNYTINVSLVPQTYTATFDARNNGNSAAIPSQTRGHGKRLEKPADPTYGMQLFLGWYYLDSDDGGKEKKWDFNEDRLTKDLELYAKWLSADTLLPDLEVENNKNTYFALEEIDVSMLKVTAVFEGHDEGGETITQRVELTSDQYVLEYEGGKSQFHVKADGSKAVVTIKYTFINSEGEEQEGTYDLKITVNPIVLNTSVLREKYFKDTVVVVKEVDGVAQPQEMKPLTDKQISEISNLSGATVEYKYYNISEDEIDKSEVKAKGTYYVRAYFTPTSIEYTAPYIQAKFQIVDTRIALTLTWKDDQTEFTYNGKVQHPIPIFTDAEGETVNVEFEYTSGHDKIKANLAGDTYTLELELKDLAYELKGTGTLGGNTASVTFTISRATFEIPTQIKNFEYIGQEIDLNNLTETECKLYFKGFDLSFMRVQFGEGVVGDKGTDAGHYTARIELLDPESAEFVGGKNVVSMNWTIDKALISVDWSGHEFYVQDAIKVPTVQQFYGFYGSDGELVDYSADIDYSGDIAVTSDGDYQITVYVKP
ncbi:MAG: InlB B-repeat-containing protein, partial [Clostridia bacterium]|nr:InlB B-repeat-containing protein [Clostridia bacterium]